MDAEPATSAARRPPAAPALDQLREDLYTARRYNIGFPGATDLAFSDLADLLTGSLLNNVGDPWLPGLGLNHTKHFEQQVISTVGAWFGAPHGCWGYVTTGASEGTLHAMDEAWQAFAGDLVVYSSAAGHYSIAKAARLLKLPLVMVRTDETGRIDCDDLESELSRRREHPALIVATAGTTMTEAVDDVAAIVKVCQRLAITRRRVHVDAALSGIPLALLPQPLRPAFDFTAGATSMVVSGHKFLGTLMPCAVLVYHRQPHAVAAGRPSYVGSADTTITGSRSGHTPLLLWHVLTTVGEAGLRARADASRKLAHYTHQRLLDIGWETRLNPHAFTVVLRTPPQQVRDKWVLPDDGHWSHVICMPGVGKDQIDELISDLQQPHDDAAPPAPSPMPGWPASHLAGLSTGDT